MKNDLVIEGFALSNTETEKKKVYCYVKSFFITFKL